MMRVLVACEESQTVCRAFRERGHEAYSNDIIKCSGGHPEWHIMMDAELAVNGGLLRLQTGEFININNWDLIIAHPPCTYLTVTGNRWFNIDKYGESAVRRAAEREEAVKFFMLFTDLKCDKWAIENPIGIMSTRYRKPDQIIQPYMFGDPHRKATCLWIKGLPKLCPTAFVKPDIVKFSSGKTMDREYMKAVNLPPAERARVRSRTYEGIARAMAEQWGGREEEC